jgi:hypothetical protein
VRDPREAGDADGEGHAADEEDPRGGALSGGGEC